MSWNIVAECTSSIILYIIWIYSRKSHSLPTLKNKLFQICFFTTYCAMISNILSTICIYYDHYIPISINWLVTSVYFIATPLMGVVYFYYAVAIIYEDEQRLPIWTSILAIPAGLYLCIVLLNPLTHSLFSIQAEAGYTRGPYIALTYAIFYLYCLGCLVMVWLNRKQLDDVICRILYFFPVIAIVVVVIQQIFLDVVLSGSAATCALLIIYLYLQNKQIDLDYLLDIPNRRAFLNALQLHLRNQSDSPFVIVVVSLRGFKRINDTYGHSNGDECLKKVSCFIKDIAKPYQLYRFNGDEFAMMIKGEYDDQVKQIVKQLVGRMAEPWQVKYFQFILDISVGIIKYPFSADNMEDIINGIEFTMAQTKKNKAQKVCTCTPQMLVAIKRKYKVIEIIKDALAQDRFEVYFQPIWSVKEKRFTKAESLLRLPESELGPLFPNEIIPLAEETGLIVEITYQILDKVCKFIQRLISQGVKLECITVNFSGVQFNSPGVAEKVFAIIEQNSIPYDLIKIELTETVMAENQEIVAQFIEQMNSKGILIGLDDFGTGYCNFVSMMSMPIDMIKIDKSMLWSAMDNEKAALMMRSVVKTIQDMGIRVVSEGVENEEQKRFAEECGCEWIQGYYFAKPMPALEAERVMIVAQR